MELLGYTERRYAMRGGVEQGSEIGLPIGLAVDAAI